MELEKEQTAADAAPAPDAATPPPAAAPAPAPAPPAVTQTPPPAAAPAPSPPVATNGAEDPRQNDTSYWKHRFQTTQGLWESDRGRFNTALETAQTENATLRAKVRELESKQSAVAPSGAVDLSAFMTAEQIEAIGEDQAQLLVSQAQKTARAEVAKLVEQEIKPIQQARERESAQAQIERQTKFLEKLTSLTPNWQEINVSPEWLAYLNGDDETTAINRQQIINTAQAQGNPEPIHKMLQAFIKSQNATAPPPPPSPQPLGGAGGVGSEAAQESKQPEITRAYIRDFVKARNTKTFKGTEKEANEIWARIQAANDAGLIRR